MKTPTVLRSLLLALAVTATAGLKADVIVDTGSNLSGSSWLLGSVSWAAYPQALGAKFTLGGNTTITSIEGFLSGNDALLDISIASDGGSLPGGNLYSASTFVGAQDGISWHGVSGLNWTLAAGDYWVVFSGQAGYSGTLMGSAPSALGVEAFTNVSDGNWYNYNGLDISVRINGEPSSVPDSGSPLACAGLALVAVALLRRRRA